METDLTIANAGEADRGSTIAGLAQRCGRFWLLVLRTIGLARKGPLYLSKRERVVGSIPLTGVLVVCGDCAGDGPVARKTQMTRQCLCDHCGSRHFVNAGLLFAGKISTHGSTHSSHFLDIPGPRWQESDTRPC